MDRAFGSDIRRALRLMILIAVTSGVVYCRDTTRAFWLGFLIAYAVSINQGMAEYLDGIVPLLQWPDKSAEVLPTNPVVVPISALVKLAYPLVMGLSGGCVSSAVYTRINKRSD